MQQVQVYIARRRPAHRTPRRSIGSAEVSPYTKIRSGKSRSSAPLRIGARAEGISSARLGVAYPRPDQAATAVPARVPHREGSSSIGSGILPHHPGPDHLGPAPGVAREQSGDLAGRPQALAVAKSASTAFGASMKRARSHIHGASR